jgi:hypothetical protein
MTKIMKNNNEPVDLRHEVTQNFKIKVYSNNDQGKTINSLRGYSGMISLIGEELAHKFMICSLMSDTEKQVYKLRRGLTITFYSI